MGGCGGSASLSECGPSGPVPSAVSFLERGELISHVREPFRSLYPWGVPELARRGKGRVSERKALLERQTGRMESFGKEVKLEDFFFNVLKPLVQ